MVITGRNESSRLATTNRARNFEPRTPSLRSTDNFRRLRTRTKVKARNKRKITTESELKKNVPWFVFGFSGMSKDVSESRMRASRPMPMISRMMTFFRLGVCF